MLTEAVAGLRRRRFGSTPTPFVVPRFEQLDLMDIDRTDVLMHLAVKLDYLKRAEVEVLAKQLYQDSLAGVTRSLAEVCTLSGLIGPSSPRKYRNVIKRNTFLNHVGLSYTQDEMGVDYDSSTGQFFKPSGRGDLYFGSYNGIEAGLGAPRPLLLNLYRPTNNTMEMVVNKKDGEEYFIPGPHAEWRSGVRDLVYEDKSRFLNKHNLLLVVNSDYTGCRECHLPSSVQVVQKAA